MRAANFHEPLRFSIAINGIAAMEHFSTAENDIELVINANDQRLVGNSLDLEFRLENPQSPAECGINDDSRKLGIGLKRLWMDF